MKKFIYYPGFEVQQDDWLKFALLYLEELSPIIPESGDQYLTDFTTTLMNETDLLNIRRPSTDEAAIASYEAIDQVEKIVLHPTRYQSVFNIPDILDLWRDPRQHQAELFVEKYNAEWADFCSDNGLATRSSEGSLIPKQLALIYMSILAQTIADREGVSPITDYRDLDRLSILMHKVDPGQEEALSTAQIILELKLPQNLSDIPIGQIVEHRNRPQFKQRLRAFHTTLDDFLGSIEEVGVDAEEFVRSLGNAWSDFSSEIVQIGTGAVVAGLGVWLLLNSPDAASTTWLREALGVVAVAIGSTMSVKSAWKRTSTTRLARRYVSDLTKLEPANVV